MIVLIGASGSGKTTFQNALIEKYGYKKIVTYTTRPPRKGEINGVDYHFISKDAFLKKKIAGEFLEFTEYRGWYYGTLIVDYCNSEKSIAVLTPSGLRELKRAGIDVYSIYIDVDRKSLLKKILDRGDDIDEAYRRNLSDVGQFDGVKNEVDLTIHNWGYRYSIDEMLIIFKSKVTQDKGM